MGVTFRFCSLGSFGDGTWYVERFTPLTQVYNQFFNIKNCFINLCTVPDPNIPNKIVTTSRSTPYFTISLPYFQNTTTTTRLTTSYNTYPYTNKQNRDNETQYYISI